MKRFLFLLVCSIWLAASSYAASPGRVAGRVIDRSNDEWLIGAVVELAPKNGSASKSTMTDVDGRFTVQSVPYGEYRVMISFLGYATVEKEISVASPVVDLGTIDMKMDDNQIEAVVLEVPAMRTSQKGDTVVYNATAFKVAADADTESLIAKMPGIMIAADGSVQAQGETIQKVFVDGKEFFGDDVSTAIKNLPADVVESVEVFNKLSDQAEFTGLDDGEGYKAINITTSEGKRRGQFGKLYAAYGYPDYYTAGGNVNIFEGDSRISIIGLFNNINQQNFSFEDILGVVNAGGRSSSGGMMAGGGGRGVGGFLVRPQDGISTVQAVGINYIDTWGKRDNVDVTASYFFNHSKTRNEYTNEIWQDPNQYNYETGHSLSENYNHRFDAKIDYDINENQNLMLRPRFRYQSYSSTDWAHTDMDNTEGALIEAIQSIIGNDDNTRSGYSASLDAFYRVKLGKPGRTLTLRFDGDYDKDNDLQMIEEGYYFPRYVDGAQADSLANQRINSNSYSYEVGGGIIYTEPLSKKSQLNLEYRIQYEYSDANKRTYLWDPVLASMNPDFDEELSTINNSGYITQRVGPGYRYADGKTNFSATLMYQYSALTNNTEYPITKSPNVRYSFNDLVYSAMANVNINPQNTLRIHARSRTDNPSVSELQDVPDFSNNTTVVGGNSSLRPAYVNRLHAFYINSDVEHGRTLSVMIGAEYTADYIGDSIVTYSADRPFQIPNSSNMLQQGQRYSRYVNLGSSWSVFGGIGYGLPVKFLGSNLNFNIGAMLAQTPNVMDGEKYVRNESYFNGGVQLSSNISENVDFTLMYNGSYNIASSVMNGVKSQDRFVNHYASASLKFVIWKGITLTANASYSQYDGITDDYHEQYLLCNIYLGKKIFRNQLGEISIGVNDLFNQNKSFRRTVWSSYIQNSTNLAIGRYVALQFVYNLRNFGKKASRASSDYDNFNTGGSSVGISRSGGRPGPGGPPPHM